jgi:hypothetical protein
MYELIKQYISRSLAEINIYDNIEEFIIKLNYVYRLCLKNVEVKNNFRTIEIDEVNVEIPLSLIDNMFSELDEITVYLTNEIYQGVYEYLYYDAIRADAKYIVMRLHDLTELSPSLDNYKSFMDENYILKFLVQ